jgi:hypothetical protein
MTVKREIRDLYTNHVSPKGNRIIAEALFDYLQQEISDVISQYQNTENTHQACSE